MGTVKENRRPLKYFPGGPLRRENLLTAAGSDSLRIPFPYSNSRIEQNHFSA
jgi:hypothetical protein